MWRCITILFLLFIASCAQFKQDYQQIFASKERREFKEKVVVQSKKIKGGKLQIQGSSDSCFAFWTYHQGNLVFDNFQCMLSLHEVSSLLDEMLKHLMLKLKHPTDLKSFRFDIRTLLDLETRLALGAYKDENWNHSTGAPHDESSSINDYIKKYMEERNAYFELKSLFSRECYTASIEEIREAKAEYASSLPFYPSLREERVGRSALLPVEYHVHLSIAAKNEQCFRDF